MTDGFDLGGLLQQAAAMQERLLEAQRRVSEEVVTGSAGGGAVQVDVTGAGEYVAVRIAPSCVDPADVSMLEDLVLAALRDAGEQLRDVAQDAMGGFEPAGLGDLGGLLGGGPGGGSDLSELGEGDVLDAEVVDAEVVDGGASGGGERGT